MNQVTIMHARLHSSMFIFPVSIGLRYAQWWLLAYLCSTKFYHVEK